MASDAILDQTREQVKAAFWVAVRVRHPCKASIHTKAGHSDVACLVCRGSLINKKGQAVIGEAKECIDRLLDGEG